MVDEDHPPRARCDEIAARQQPDRAVAGIDRNRGPVVDVLDLLGDVDDEIVRVDRQRLAVGHALAGGGEGDHAAAHVGVERADDDPAAALTCELADLRLRGKPVARDQHRGAELDRLSLSIDPVADDDDIAGGDPAVASRRIDRVHPDAAADRAVLTLDQLAVEDLADRRDGGRCIGEAVGPAGIADVTMGQGALGHHPDQLTAVADDRDDVEVAGGHRLPDRANRLLVAGDRELLPHHVADPEEDVHHAVRRAGPAALEHPGRLSVDLSEPDRHVLALGVELLLQLGVGDRRRDRVGVGVAVAGDVDPPPAGIDRFRFAHVRG